MIATLQPRALPAVSPEVRAFAQENGVTDYLHPVLEMTRRLFAEATLCLCLEDDPEMLDDRHLVIGVRAPGMDIARAVDARYQWHAGLYECCPAPSVPVFRLALKSAS